MPLTAPTIFIFITPSASAFILARSSGFCAAAPKTSSAPAAAMYTSLFMCILLLEIALSRVHQPERVGASIGSKNNICLYVAGLYIHPHNDSRFKRFVVESHEIGRLRSGCPYAARVARRGPFGQFDTCRRRCRCGDSRGLRSERRLRQ